MERVKLKVCKGCNEKFAPSRAIQSVCSPRCQRKAEEIREARKAERAKSREQVARYGGAAVAVSETAKLIKKLEAITPMYIKLRDWGLPCISCGKPHRADFQAGHYHNRSTEPRIKLNAINIHSQCEECNVQKAGNKAGYKQGIIDRYGLDKLEMLESLPEIAAPLKEIDLHQVIESRGREIEAMRWKIKNDN